MEFLFQAQDYNALAISIVRFLVALPPSGTCYSAPNICSSQPELWGAAETAALREFKLAHVRFGSKADFAPCLDYVRFTPENGHRAQ